MIIAVLFSAGNAKKNVFTVFIDPIVTIDGFSEEIEDALKKDLKAADPLRFEERWG